MKLKTKWYMYVVSFFILVSSVLVVEEKVCGAEMHKETLAVTKNEAAKKSRAKKKAEIRKFEKVILPAYEKYVRENFSKAVAHDSPYSFIYLNNDNIPELVVEGGFSAAGCLVCTYNKGVVALISSVRLLCAVVVRRDIPSVRGTERTLNRVENNKHPTYVSTWGFPLMSR